MNYKKPGLLSLCCFLFDVDSVCRIKFHAAWVDYRKGQLADRRQQAPRHPCVRPVPDLGEVPVDHSGHKL